jgi:hypothetical protein
LPQAVANARIEVVGGEVSQEISTGENYVKRDAGVKNS